ncbi:hypothetical protein BO70DRAFT_401092 [Aspergillus heteromorphus CBS 117.55]|uniref:Uncharacterized protein n=1 Tax=Aspergillus heteromorphus CBS 117.55 TaxID=1448321 RepID=A0A317UW17_9EURO|nr:uncharacterized protein BO70DRAFT_401092 [Aspergillus heteromorphus CBS 117.55]PWY65609.1 hypothetical protein BO70DRAFT_401092 [Aspergillus heteromorphus CBS 117.55]
MAGLLPVDMHLHLEDAELREVSPPPTGSPCPDALDPFDPMDTAPDCPQFESDIKQTSSSAPLYDGQEETFERSAQYQLRSVKLAGKPIALRVGGPGQEKQYLNSKVPFRTPWIRPVHHFSPISNTANFLLSPSARPAHEILTTQPRRSPFVKPDFLCNNLGTANFRSAGLNRSSHSWAFASNPLLACHQHTNLSDAAVPPSIPCKRSFGEQQEVRAQRTESGPKYRRLRFGPLIGGAKPYVNPQPEKVPTGPSTVDPAPLKIFPAQPNVTTAFADIENRPPSCHHVPTGNPGTGSTGVTDVTDDLITAAQIPGAWPDMAAPVPIEGWAAYWSRWHSAIQTVMHVPVGLSQNVSSAVRRAAAAAGTAKRHVLEVWGTRYISRAYGYFRTQLYTGTYISRAYGYFRTQLYTGTYISRAYGYFRTQLYTGTYISRAYGYFRTQLYTGTYISRAYGYFRTQLYTGTYISRAYGYFRTQLYTGTYISRAYGYGT